VLTGLNINPTNVPTSMNEGFNGKRTDEVRGFVLPIFVALQPRNVLMIMGVNDIHQGESAAATLTEVHGFCNDLLAAGNPYLQHVFVSNLPLGTTEVADGCTAFNTGMAAEFAGADPRIIVVDTTSTLVQGTDFADGLHPNDGGYQKMANAWYAALQAVYPAL